MGGWVDQPITNPNSGSSFYFWLFTFDFDFDPDPDPDPELDNIILRYTILVMDNCKTVNLKGVIVVVQICLFIGVLKGQLYINCSPEVRFLLKL